MRQKKFMTKQRMFGAPNLRIKFFYTTAGCDGWLFNFFKFNSIHIQGFFKAPNQMFGIILRFVFFEGLHFMLSLLDKTVSHPLILAFHTCVNSIFLIWCCPLTLNPPSPTPGREVVKKMREGHPFPNYFQLSPYIQK